MTTTWCGWCRKTIAHLDQNGIRYDNRDIERDRAAYADLKRKTGSTAVPVIEIDGEIVRGFDRDRIEVLPGAEDLRVELEPGTHTARWVEAP